MQRVKGLVLKVVGSSTLVEGEDGSRYTCDLRGKLSRRKGERLAVGDRVELTPTVAPSDDPPGPGAGVIEEIAPRRTTLRRARDLKRDQVICANVDQVVLVVAALDPPYKRAFLDRVLVGVEREGLDACIVINKVDLGDAGYLELLEEDAEVYRALGYQVLLTSAEDGTSLDELTAAFQGRISAVVGPSGVGKSTLLNQVCPGLTLRTGAVSEKDGRGKHTTTSAELVRLPRGGYVVDTPGLRAFGLWDLEPGEVAYGFRELRELSGSCRFRDCAHRTEPGCAVRAATESGELDPERYESYLRLKEEVESDAAQRQATRRR